MKVSRMAYKVLHIFPEGPCNGTALDHKQRNVGVEKSMNDVSIFMCKFTVDSAA